MVLVLPKYLSPEKKHPRVGCNPPRRCTEKTHIQRIYAHRIYPSRFSTLMLMDLWQLEMDTLTVGSVVGVVELKGQCMSFQLPHWGVEPGGFDSRRQCGKLDLKAPFRFVGEKEMCQVGCGKGRCVILVLGKKYLQNKLLFTDNLGVKKMATRVQIESSFLILFANL